MKFLLYSLLLLSISSCRFLGMGERVNGDGKIATQQRSTSDFHTVEANGSVTVKIRQGATHSVKLETDENLLAYIEVFTSGDKLVIRSREGYNLRPTEDIIAYVSAPSFREVAVSGACDIISDGTISGNHSLNLSVSGSGNIEMEVDVAQLSSRVSGSGSVFLKGRANDFSASISGSGEIMGYELSTETSKLSISGAGVVQITASKLLDVKVSGSGDVHYRGSPQVTQRISGAGSVVKVG